MAREPKLVTREDDGTAPALLPAAEKVTYTPGPEGPMETTWMGHKFTANVPRDIEIPDQSVMEAFAKPAADRSRVEVDRLAGLSKKMTTNAQLVTSARTNRFFHVGEFDPTKHGYKEVVSEPKTAEAYRAWAVNWAKGIWLSPTGTIDDLCERWANEARMRNRLEVGFDDFHYMSSLFQPMVDELVRRSDEPRRKRDELIRNRELDGLILQIAGVGQAAA